MKQPFSQIYVDRVQATQGTQAAPIGNEIQMQDHERNVCKPSSPI